MFYKETIKRFFDIVVCEYGGEWHWDLYYARAGFATYLKAYGKDKNKDAAIETAQKYAHLLANKHKYLDKENYGRKNGT